MRGRAIHVVLLISAFVLALFLLIASSKYAAWAKEMAVSTGAWVPLILYVGAVPLVSLVYTTFHLAALQFDRLPTPPYDSHWPTSLSRQDPEPTASDSYNPEYGVSSTLFVLCVSVFHSLIWLAQAVLCTSCELAPVLAGTEGRVPAWCPQSRFKDTGKPELAPMLGTLAEVKDFAQWVMVLITLISIECARREYARADHVNRAAWRAQGAGVDLGGPRRAFEDADGKPRALGRSMEMEAIQISGPRLFRPEEVFVEEEKGGMRLQPSQQQPQPQPQQQKWSDSEQRDVKYAPPNPRDWGRQPTATRAPRSKDNYYGNGMGSQTEPKLNYMYESRV